ncbi:hypothetical protein HS088_TW11G00394 [Tripterygium wilfordii]|uniref:rRNA methyltransferase YlbH n=1 Tax=Tripterygium wilfordii TaxID=458696 RepID=A0A7J7D1V1_TRIWF|nr:putative rRNA methyltransferase YlbH [Tripterygium wilfordii]KAF5740327.1 hypothetical protein HS088_TW11G00394 [Tripterygium wilfordii]
MALSSSPIVSPLSVDINTKLFASSHTLPLLNSFPSKNFCHRPSIVVCSQKSDSGLLSAKKKELFERYGLDPNDYLSEDSPKTRRRSEEKKTQRAKQVPEEDPKPPRTTHRLLQVLGGKAKRKKLLSPKGMDVRPMMEVVKGAAFDILQAAGGCPASLRPGRWLDLYSGTGSVGIEAISRGCSEVHFVEMDPWVVENVLQPNLEWTGFDNVSVIHAICVESFLDRADQFVGRNGPFDYVSVTPPYMEVDYGVLMKQISQSAIIGEDTFIVVEYPLRTEMSDSCGCLEKIKDRRFGRTHLAIYGPKWAQKKRMRKVS